jgi:hypothetical protein
MPEETADQSLAGYRDRYRSLQAQLTELGFISSGSVVRRHTFCGKAGCRCQADPPQPHGPYWQWTRKVGGKTVSRRLTPREAALYREWIANSRRLSAIVGEMETVSQRAAELILGDPELD